jgi:hypothetical protein
MKDKYFMKKILAVVVFLFISITVILVIIATSLIKLGTGINSSLALKEVKEVKEINEVNCNKNLIKNPQEIVNPKNNVKLVFKNLADGIFVTKEKIAWSREEKCKIRFQDSSKATFQIMKNEYFLEKNIKEISCSSDLEFMITNSPQDLDLGACAKSELARYSSFNISNNNLEKVYLVENNGIFSISVDKSLSNYATRITVPDTLYVNKNNDTSKELTKLIDFESVETQKKLLLTLPKVSNEYKITINSALNSNSKEINSLELMITTLDPFSSKISPSFFYKMDVDNTGKIILLEKM